MIVLINMVRISMTSTKMATPGLLKIRVFWKKGYDVIISVHDVIKKFLSRDPNYKQMWTCDQSLVTVAFL